MNFQSVKPLFHFQQFPGLDYLPGRLAYNGYIVLKGDYINNTGMAFQPQRLRT